MGNTPTKGPQQKNRRNKKYVHWEQAVPPWPPGKPHLVPGSPNSQPNVVTIRWDPPPDDGGAPITGYVVEHRKTGTPHWMRATTDLVLQPEVELSGLEPGWRYQFRVTAENAADLLSDPGELSQPLTVARAYHPATMAPQFSLQLQDTVALENEKAEFTVNFHGIPTPKIAWYKDSFEIFSSRRMRVIIENDLSALIIHQTAFTDEGEYKCAATNRAGHVITKAKLRLEAPPRIRIPRQYEDGLIFEKDEVIRLKVSVAGRPLPRATWYHDGEPIPFGGRYEVSNTDRSSGLRISEARRMDRGEYQVRATSRLGEDTVSFLVTVTDRPMPPGRTEVVKAAGRSVTLVWTEPADDGGCKIGNYIVEYYRLGWNVWLKAATCRHLTAALSDLIEGSEYKFRVKAENPYGVSDPSTESEVVFIPDPKRGLLERPVRAIGSQTDIPLPDRQVDKKNEPCHSKDSKDSSMGKHSETKEIKKKKECDRKKLKSELMEKLQDRHSVIQHEVPDVATRHNKENYEKRSTELPEDLPEIKRQRKPSTGELEVEGFPASLSWKTPTESEKSLKASLQFSLAKRRGSSGEHDSGVSEGSFSEGKQSFMSPPLLREDDSLLHGSSELMLVLLPEARSMQREKDAEGNSEFAIFGDSSVPPPLSLSAPELGSGEPWATSLLRNAVSSTELLHEQAMERFYQAVAEEEAEKSRRKEVITDHKSVETPTRSTETGELSKKLRRNSPESTPEEEHAWHQRKHKELQDRQTDNFEAALQVKRASRQSEFNTESILRRREPVKLSSAEEERTTFERMRMETVTEAEEGKTKEETELYEREEEEEIQEENEEEVEEEEEEELENDSCDNEELEEEESSEEESSEFDEEEELYKSMEEEEEEEEEEETYHLGSTITRHIDRFAEQEDDTYHPWNMVPAASNLEFPLAGSRRPERQFTPQSSVDATAAIKTILKHNSKFQDDLEDMIERRLELPSRDLERSPPKSFRETVPKQLTSSFISNTRSHSPSTRPESQRPGPSQLDVYSMDEFGMNDDKISISAESARFLENHAKSNISSPEHTKPSVDHIIRISAPALSAAESAKQKRRLIRKASVEEDTEASKAVAEYYGDIIRDHARPKKPVRQFLNTAEMKAAANVSQKQESNTQETEPKLSHIPRPEPETRISVGAQVYAAEQSAHDRHTAPVQRPQTPLKKSTTPDLVLIRSSSKDRSPVPSTERFSAKRLKQFSEVARHFSPERIQPEKPQIPCPIIPKQDEQLQETEKKWRSLLSYLADLAMFLVACWLYAFKDERLAIPVLVLMVYRQLHDAIKRRLKKLPQLPWKRSS